MAEVAGSIPATRSILCPYTITRIVETDGRPGGAVNGILHTMDL